jgi:DNA polymerase-3 subunit gamma/tau
MSISLYRKYRPQKFSDVIGQQHIVQTLSNAISHDRISHAYLFTGPRGTGKTTLARIFAKTINCTSLQLMDKKNAEACMECDNCKNIGNGKSLDVFEIDAASNTGVDNIRELRENVKFPPSQAKYKVYIIDEVHMLSSGAFNALLKTLEEPPAHVIFILATTEIHKVPETIVSRCQRFDFVRLTIDQIIEKLSNITTSEGIKIEKEALEMIAIGAEGGMRDGESILSQIISFEDKNITALDVSNILGTTTHESLFRMSQFLLKKDASSAISLINNLSENGQDLEIFNKSLLNNLRQLMLIATDEKLSDLFSREVTKEQLEQMCKLAREHTPVEILKILQCFSDIQNKIRSSYIPQLPLEMATIKSLGGVEIEIEPAQVKVKPIYQIPTPKKPEVTQIIAPVINEKLMENQKNENEVTPKTQSAQTSEEATPTKSGEFSLNDVKKHWNSAIPQIKLLNHSTAAILVNCKPIKVDGNTITIAAKFGFHKDKLAEPKNKLTIEEVFDKILGCKVLISVLTAEEAGIKFESSMMINNANAAKEDKPSETSSLLTDAIGIMGGRLVGDQGQNGE